MTDLFNELVAEPAFKTGPVSGIDRLLHSLGDEEAVAVRKALLAQNEMGYLVGPVILSRRLRKRGWPISDMQIIRYRKQNGAP